MKLKQLKRKQKMRRPFPTLIFYESSITLIPNLNTNSTKKKKNNYRPISFISIDIKIFNKI